MSNPEDRSGVTPTGLATPWGPLRQPARATTDRTGQILDSALALCARQGVAVTTMAQLAEEAGISRMWLYKHFENKDAVVRAVIGREVDRFLAGMIAAVRPGLSIAEVVVDASMYSLGFLRGHELLQRLLITEPDVMLPYLTTDAGALYSGIVQSAAPFISAIAPMDLERAEFVAEVLARFLASVLLTPPASIDFSDPSAARAAFSRLAGALLA